MRNFLLYWTKAISQDDDNNIAPTLPGGTALFIIATITIVSLMLLGLCAVAGCMVSSQNSRRLEQSNREQAWPRKASGF